MAMLPALLAETATLVAMAMSRLMLVDAVG
jgi:hypothetical protein